MYNSLNAYIEKWVKEILPMTLGCQCPACRVAGWRKHDSDCAVHSYPAYPAGPCNCSMSAEAK